MNLPLTPKSHPRSNTGKVAKAMAEAMNATLKKVEEARPEELAGYDLGGMGSGIYVGKYHKDLIKSWSSITLGWRKMWSSCRRQPDFKRMISLLNIALYSIS